MRTADWTRSGRSIKNVCSNGLVHKMSTCIGSVFGNTFPRGSRSMRWMLRESGVEVAKAPRCSSHGRTLQRIIEQELNDSAPKMLAELAGTPELMSHDRTQQRPVINADTPIPHDVEERVEAPMPQKHTWQRKKNGIADFSAPSASASDRRYEAGAARRRHARVLRPSAVLLGHGGPLSWPVGTMSYRQSHTFGRDSAGERLPKQRQVLTCWRPLGRSFVCVT